MLDKNSRKQILLENLPVTLTLTLLSTYLPTLQLISASLLHLYSIMNRIFSDKEVFEQIKEKCRPAYVRTWKSFKDLKPTINFEEGPIGEDCCMDFFRVLRQEKKLASTTMWTSYSQLNSTMKQKYGVQLQDFPRVTMLLKS